MVIAAIILAVAAVASNGGLRHTATRQGVEAQIRFRNDAAQRLAPEPSEVARTYIGTCPFCRKETPIVAATSASTATICPERIAIARPVVRTRDGNSPGIDESLKAR